MAYKAHPMISPLMTREFILPSYIKWVNLCKQYNIPIIDMVSDGFVEDLVPVWIDGGINVCDPMEVAAGNDIIHFRELFGRDMAYSGGIDKRAMAKGGKVLEAEISRIAPVLETGGYIPTCDHGIPHDVSFKNYREFAAHVARITGWL
jgi:uroporphyrinogen decarboxylase